MKSDHELDAMALAIKMLAFDELSFWEMHTILKQAGVYAPAISTMAHIRTRFPALTDEQFAEALTLLKDRTINFVAKQYQSITDGIIERDRIMNSQPSIPRKKR